MGVEYDIASFAVDTYPEREPPSCSDVDFFVVVQVVADDRLLQGQGKVDCGNVFVFNDSAYACLL